MNVYPTAGAPTASSLSFCRFDERFLDSSWRWLHDPEIKHLTLTPDFTRDDQLRWFAGLSRSPDYLIWGVEYEGKPVGAVGLKNVDLTAADYFGYIGERVYWGRGLGRAIITFAIDTARKRGLQTLRVRVRADNVRAVRLYLRTGFATLLQEGNIIYMSKSLSESTPGSMRYL